MGYLHQGHLSLITESKKHTQLTVVSIYVNPGQFAVNEDLSTYPSDFQGDIEKLKSIPNGVDVVFNPQNLYDYGVKRTQLRKTEKEGEIVSCLEDEGGRGIGHETWIRVEKLEQGMCGKSRPVFFRGVATVVAKLFNIVEPDVAVFGKKKATFLSFYVVWSGNSTPLTLLLAGTNTANHHKPPAGPTTRR